MWVAFVSRFIERQSMDTSPIERHLCTLGHVCRSWNKIKVTVSSSLCMQVKKLKKNISQAWRKTTYECVRFEALFFK